MARKARWAACLGWVLWCGAAAAQTSGETPVNLTPVSRPGAINDQPKPLLRIDSSLVLIPVHVTDAMGAAVTTLDRQNFQVLEDHVEQSISSFFTEDAPVSIGLLYDASGSMRSKMQKATEAADAFFASRNPDDEFFLVEFNDRARLLVPFTSDVNEVRGRIAHARPSGRTSLLDAISLALEQMKHAHHSRKALVILSDGGDNWSRHGAGEVRTALLESDVQLYAMGIFGQTPTAHLSVEERNGPRLLTELADLSGGHHFPVETLDDLPAISQRISRELHIEYLLGYRSTNSRCDGKYRHIQVNVTAPHEKELRVRFRHGYYAATAE